jgi:spore maturation protein CgeB
LKVCIVGLKPHFNLEMYYGNALQGLGHEVEYIYQYQGVERVFLTRFLITRSRIPRIIVGRLPINDQLVLSLRRINPDTVLIIKGETLSRRALRAASAAYPLYLLYPDNYHFSHLLVGRSPYYRALIVSACNTERFSDYGFRKVHTLPFACDPDVHRPLGLEKEYAYSFVGSAYLRRYLYLRHLAGVEVFGQGWQVFPRRSSPPVYGPEYVEVIDRTRVNIDIHHRTNIASDDASMRPFEVCGCGGFLLSDYVPSLHKYLPMIPVYRDPEDFVGMAKWYLENPKERQEVATSARELCYERHTYRDRANELVRIMG